MANLRTRNTRGVRHHTRTSKTVSNSKAASKTVSKTASKTIVSTSATEPSSDSLEPLPPLPIDDQLWQAVMEELQLSQQHAKIVDLILRGLSDKEITQIMGIHRSTLRAYFARIAIRTGANGRIAIMQKVLTVSHKIR